MEVKEEFQTKPSFSGAPTMAIAVVIVILTLIGMGLRFKRG
jgi:hypothetical protein